MKKETLPLDPILHVKEFTETFKLDWFDKPTVPTDQTAFLRVQLVVEELGELAHALAANDRVEVADALTDIDYVTYGAMGAFGTYTLSVGFLKPNVGERQWGELSASELLERFHQLAYAINVATQTYSVALASVGCGEELMKQHFSHVENALMRVLQETTNFWAVTGLLQHREACFLEVQRSNMSKLGEDGQPIFNEAGRVSKGPNFSAPDLAAILGAE